MRQLLFKPKAHTTLYDIADWLSSQYFPETGEKYVDDVAKFLTRYSDLNYLKYPLCKNKRLARRKLSCVVYKRKWIIAFKYTRTTFTVHEFIWGGKLK